LSLFSGVGCWAWAYALFFPAKLTGAAVSASPATMLRLVSEVVTGFAIVASMMARDRAGFIWSMANVHN
jgi:hypothetical protein